MRDVETLIKLVIPALFLIFWALSNLFNREVASNRAKDRASGLGPRPDRIPPGGPYDRDRPSGSPTTAPPRYVPPTNDEILIIRSEANRPASRPGNPQPRRNQGRSRTQPAPA